jgi:hypothetical protein
MGKQLYKPLEKIGKTHGKHRAKPRYLRGETWVVDFPPTQCINQKMCPTETGAFD